MENKENNIPPEMEVALHYKLLVHCLQTKAKKAINSICSSGGFAMQGQQLIDLNLGGEEK